MSVLSRGVKNAFRNSVRTLSVVVILSISIGLALVMLLSYQTVQDRITRVKSSTGNTITINPAGARGFDGGGEPLTSGQITTLQGLSHVTTVTGTLSDRLNAGQDTSLLSAIDAGTLGKRVGNQQQRQFEAAPDGPPASSTKSSSTTRTFTPPIMITGALDLSSLKLTSGSLFAQDSTEKVAVVGSALATKNSLSLGSTFTAYSTTIQVVGIFDAGNEFGSAGLYLPIKTLQTLSEQVDQYNTITVTADSMDNVESVVAQIKSTLGSDTVDVTSSAEAATTTISSLENIRSISIYSLVGSLMAGAVITLLIMIMIVRERRKEIGVLKAIGASNLSVVIQFVVEAQVLTVLGALVGSVLGVLLSNPVLSVLVKNNSTAQTPGPGMGRMVALGGQVGGGIRDALTNLHASVGLEIILYGLLAAVVIAMIGSAVPAWLIAKVRPAEVMRSE